MKNKAATIIILFVSAVLLALAFDGYAPSNTDTPVEMTIDGERIALSPNPAF